MPSYAGLINPRPSCDCCLLGMSGSFRNRIVCEHLVIYPEISPEVSLLHRDSQDKHTTDLIILNYILRCKLKMADATGLIWRNNALLPSVECAMPTFGDPVFCLHLVSE